MSLVCTNLEKSSLAKHKQTIHMIKNLSSPNCANIHSQKTFNCKIFSKNFKWILELQARRGKAHCNIQCDKCSKCFNNKTVLINHLQVCLQLFECDEYKEQFSTRFVIIDCLKTHTRHRNLLKYLLCEVK